MKYCVWFTCPCMCADLLELILLSFHQREPFLFFLNNLLWLRLESVMIQKAWTHGAHYISPVTGSVYPVSCRGSAPAPCDPKQDKCFRKWMDGGAFISLLKRNNSCNRADTRHRYQSHKCHKDNHRLNKSRCWVKTPPWVRVRSGNLW